MNSVAPSDPYIEIDRLVCGSAFVPTETATRSCALQAAVKDRLPADSLCSAIVSALLPLRLAGPRVALFTGFVVPETFPIGETDGPLGAAALARALSRCGFAVEIHADPQVVDHMTWLAAEIGADVSVSPIPDVPPEGIAASIDVAIAIEKPGMNSAGYMHDWSGRRIEAGSISIDALFVELSVLGRLTIAIGDRGNEIGFGAIHDEILALIPSAGRCSCGCGGGVAAITPATLLYPAAVSNWGAYGVCAGLAIALKDPSLLLHPEEERRLLNVAAVRGCRDGLLKTAAFGVDGISGSTSMHVVRALHQLANTELGSR